MQTEEVHLKRGVEYNTKIRTIFTKLRTDSNCTRDSRYRSYSDKKDENNICAHCDVSQDVLHVLIRCNYPGVKKKTTIFYDKIF